MRIDENYSLENDAHQWILKYERQGDINQKTGNPTKSESKWYCGTINQALQRYLDESLKPAQNIEQLKGILDLSMERVIELTDKL